MKNNLLYSFGLHFKPLLFISKNKKPTSRIFTITQRLAGKLVWGLWSDQFYLLLLINLLNGQVSASPFSIKVQTICTHFHYIPFI